MLASSALIMGRHTYELMAPVWPTMTGNPLADKMNHNADGPGLAQHQRHRRRSGRCGEGAEVDLGGRHRPVRLRSGDAAGLLDRLRLWVHPFILGRGGPQDLLFREGPVTGFQLTEATALESGIVILDYRLSRNAPAEDQGASTLNV